MNVSQTSSDLIEFVDGETTMVITIQCFPDKLLKALIEKVRNNQRGEIGD